MFEPKNVHRRCLLTASITGLFAISTSALTTPALAQSASVGSPSVVNLSNTGLNGNFFPDAHLSFLWDSIGNTYQMYWGEWESYRTTGSSPTTQTGAIRVLGDQPFDRANPGYFDNSGSWMMSVFKVNPGTFTKNTGSSYLIGFYHAEDHFFNGVYQDPVAWNGVGLAKSYDNGISWSKQGIIIGVPGLKPATATWGGIGNQCTILDDRSNPSVPRWITFFPTVTPAGETQGWGITAAASTAPDAARSSWYQWYNGGFSILQSSNEGVNSSLPGLDNPATTAGGNISVQWNTYLNRWVMIYRSWDGKYLKLSYSSGNNPTQWTQSTTIVTAPVTTPNETTVSYPSIIGTNAQGKLSDVESGQNATIYYARFQNGVRQMIKQSVTFRR